MPKLTAWNKITGIQAYRLADTSEMDREKWLQMRRMGIGGSEIAAIAGINPFKSAVAVYLEKTGMKPPDEENEKMKWGKLLEDPVAREYSEQTGYKVQKCNAILQHPKHPWALCNIDRLAKNSSYGVLEVKTTAWAHGWEEGSVPEMYLCQAMWYLGITGLKWAQFAALLQGNKLIIPDKMKLDENAFGRLVQIGEKFWKDHIEKKVPPAPAKNTDPSDYAWLYPDQNDVIIDLPEDVNPLLKKYKELKSYESQVSGQAKQISSLVLAKLGENKRGQTSQFKVTRVLSSGKAYFDEKTFKQDDPELHTKYMKTGSPYSYVLINPKK